MLQQFSTITKKDRNKGNLEQIVSIPNLTGLFNAKDDWTNLKDERCSRRREKKSLRISWLMTLSLSPLIDCVLFCSSTPKFTQLFKYLKSFFVFLAIN
ncbi:CLUMA_CG011094, isoform A [Clunio marinus]|uniref:CLUMA_CG011094, isoform A n=1 Tax=Clunio marinus TaxID=568069 RepID=A0A1J1IH01_9DIPT|nr:CLUMA_CG011094, isoform A [Clunio marinus]